MAKDKVLITGANGFIGAFLVEEAQKNGLDVYAAIRKGSDISAISHLHPGIVEIDFNDISGIAKMLSTYQFTYIIHNAGLTKHPNPKEYLKVNCTYLQNVVEAIKLSEIHLKKFLFVSSLASVGPADFQKDGILNENVVPHPVTQYGVSKLAAENYLIQQHQLPYIIIRPTAVYGPREKDLFNVFQMVNKGIELNAGLKPQKLSFIFVKDLVDLMIKSLLSDQVNKAYYATDGNVYSSDDLGRIIRETLKKKTIKIKLPIVVIKTIAFCSEKMSMLWNTYPPLNIDKVHEIKARNWDCDVTESYRELGFIPRYNLEKGIVETVAWYKSNKWL